MRLRFLTLALLGISATFPLSLFASSCVPSTKNPYPPDAAGGSGGAAANGGTSDGGNGGGTQSDPTLGGPCKTDDDCNDMIACTFDACDLTIEKCRFTPDDSVCSNSKYCDGIERCDNKLGCTFGEPVGCGDGDSCTLDKCVEETQTCVYTKRDADYDGDPDNHCGGKDCDDADPLVNSLVAEVCLNFKDDNCDGTIDEASCTTPVNDVCIEALEISEPGSYAMNTLAATYDYPGVCTASLVGAADVVAALVLPPGPPIDVELTARTQYQEVALTLAGQCGDPASEIVCSGPYSPPPIVGGRIAKILGRSLGDPNKTTALPVYVTTAPTGPVTLEVAFFPASQEPTHETCGTAMVAPFDIPFPVTVVDAAKDLASGCSPATGELVYSFTLDQPQNVDIYATSTDGDGFPVLSLRNPNCALPEDEIACHFGQNAHLVAKSLPAGTYYLATAATAPTSMLVTIELSPATPAPLDDVCPGAPPLAANQTISIPLEDHQDNVQLGCLPGAVDAVYTLNLTEPSDVLLVERISLADTGAVSLVKPQCDSVDDQLACGAGAPSPVRASAHNVPAGEYRVVAESMQGSPVELSAFVRKAIPPTLVPFADSCADVLTIPSTGGFFQGTTANAAADFDAGCDQAGVPENGAPEQLLKLVLPASKRVILDMMGSSYSTLLDVRKGPDCPGTEVPLACAAGYYPSRSYLDLTLAAGTYFIQVDGYNAAAGPWFLDVRVVEP
ncbi:MAG: putative metal-binding motif-containing protein [Polyangiaceae bacterium]|nr:putative metal-binding motif-containing protein [Polyangiaceae bacterium]